MRLLSGMQEKKQKLDWNKNRLKQVMSMLIDKLR
ncbi:hypothetical protein RUMOBE_03197 [Blautia obeum ATCC 29174]|uniref:Uncharacterized protein n=1 Tax=Blautia obeum ATCC 29174 TaxID=411459 RepID=A5ZW04_9FIRM|nr:hypothetical protein RUMOBE_03197 [Blautia obeum ATCC 29174]